MTPEQRPRRGHPVSPAGALRAAGVVATLVIATAFVPLGLVLPPGRWVLALAFVSAVSALGVVGFVRGRPVAFAVPFVLIAAWFLVQR